MVVPISASNSSVRLNSYVEVAPGTARPDAVLSGRTRFVHAPTASIGGSPVDAWVHFTLPARASGDPDHLFVIARGAEVADLYVPGTPIQHGGTSVAFQARSLPVAVPSFQLPFADAPRDVYVHVRYHLDVPLGLTLQTPERFFQARMLERLVAALFIGGLLAVVLFNLYVLIALRDRTTTYFIVYVLALIVNELVSTGIGGEYVWPSIAGDGRLAVLCTTLLAFASFLVFARSFLYTREATPWLDRALVGALVLEATLMIAQYVLPVGRALVWPVLIAELLGMLVVAATAFVRWGQGFRPARYFASAFVPTVIGVFANLAYNAFLPRGNWFFAANGVEFGTLTASVIITCSVLDRLQILEAQRRVAQDALAEEERHNRQLRRLVATDALTGLANRIAFNETLATAVKAASIDDRGLAVLYIDLDEFKAINDEFGHRCGDEVLKTVARWLQAAVRSDDLVARIGGDEFAVVLPHMPSVADVERVLQTVRTAVEGSLVYEGHRLDVCASVGYSIFPGDGLSAEALLDAADRAMYEVKERHRSQALSRTNS